MKSIALRTQSMSVTGMLRRLKTLGANRFARHFTRFCRTATHSGVMIGAYVPLASDVASVRSSIDAFLQTAESPRPS
jgi:hypothetical protein